MFKNLFEHFDIWPSFIVGIASGIAANVIFNYLLKIYRGKKFSFKISASEDVVRFEGQIPSPHTIQEAKKIINVATQLREECSQINSNNSKVENREVSRN